MAETATVTVLFCDVVGSTERLVRIGDVAGDELRRDLFSGLRRSIASSGGTEVKNLGDGLMVVFPRSVVAALVCARAMHLAAAEVDPVDPVHLRIGISVGEVAEEDGDWFGLPVVEAARLCAAAGAQQTFASFPVRALVGSRAGDHHFRDIGSLQLKGLAAPISTFEVQWRDERAVPRPADGPSGRLPVASDTVGSAPAPRGRRRLAVALTASGVLVVLAIVTFLTVQAGGGSEGTDDAQVVRSDPGPAADVVTAPVGYEPEFRATTCTEAERTATPGVTCGELIVPESRAHPEGPTIAVPVAKRAASTPTAAAPVVLLDVNEPLATTSLHDVADVYALSLRGFGPGQTPTLECPELRDAWEPTLAVRADDPTAIDQRVAATTACATRLRAEGAHLEGYQMAEVAQDVRDLVRAADLGEVTVVGGGFSTAAIAAFARANPGAVRSVVLTNPIPPGHSALEDPAGWVDAAFGRIVELCEQDTACAAAHPDLRATYHDRFLSLDRDPVTVVTSSLAGTGPHQVLLDGRRWAAALESALYQSDRLGLVPEAIEGASDELVAATSIDEDVKRVIVPGALAGATLSYGCSYDAEPHRTAEISATAMPEFAGANEPSYSRMCEAWGTPSVFDELSQPLLGDVPVLLAQGSISVAGTHDWAGAMAEQLDDATVVRFATMSEDLAYRPPPCLRRLRNAFVVDPGAELDVADCEARTPPVDFVAGT